MSVAVTLTPTDPTVCIGDAQLMKIVSEKTLERVRAEYEHDRRQRGVEHGECFCGCGQRTAIARDTSIKRGWVRGMPVRFVSTHHVRLGIITTGPKQCRDCLKFLARTEFYKDSQRGDGLHPYCKPCKIARQRPAARRQRSKNRERYRNYVRSRRARLRGAEGTHTDRDVWDMLESQEHLSAYCESPLFGDFHVDHTTPIIRGGSNGPENLAIVCPSCNTRKCGATLEEFLRGQWRRR